MDKEFELQFFARLDRLIAAIEKQTLHQHQLAALQATLDTLCERTATKKVDLLKRPHTTKLDIIR